MRPTRSRLGRWAPRLLAIAVAAATLGYLGASWYVYDQLSHAEAGCPGENAIHDPTSFNVDGVDTTPYHMPPPETVTFPSRGEADIAIAAWWEPSLVRPNAPAIILVHGLNGCRRNSENLLAAGMLHRAGFSVLLIDLRDHGDSTVEDGRYAGGTDEHRDVLGAYDWLRTRPEPPERVGVLGFSLGAATAMIAFGEEPGLAAVWEDSGFADIDQAIRDELARNGYPTYLAPGGILLGRIVVGDDLAAFSPLRAVAKADGRPVFITHGSRDERLSVRYAFELAAEIWLTGGDVDPWIVAGAGHTAAADLLPDEYDRRLVAFFIMALGRP